MPASPAGSLHTCPAREGRAFSLAATGFRAYRCRSMPFRYWSKTDSIDFW